MRREVREVRRWSWGLVVLQLGCQAIVGDLDDYTFQRTRGADASGEDPNDVGCRDGERQCLGDGVQTCADGSWGEAQPCTDATPLCNGGTCSVLRLSGGLVGLSGNLGAGEYRLVAHGFEALSSLCGDANRQPLCVIGDIQP